MTNSRKSFQPRKGWMRVLEMPLEFNSVDSSNRRRQIGGGVRL